MKKLLLFSLCLAAAFSANAQFVQNGNYLDAGSSAQSVGKTGFNKIAAVVSVASYKYSTQTSHGSESGYDIGPIVGIIYTRNQRMDDTSLYLEFGGGFLFTWFPEIMRAKDFDLKLYTLYVPVNIDYRFDFGVNSYVSLFTGPYLKYNFAGSMLDLTGIFISGGAKRTQVGWQGGVDVSFGGLYLSLSYNGDISNLLDFSATDYNVKNRVSGVTFGLGVVF